MAPTGPFSVELKVFEEHRKEWSRSHLGAYVAIQDEVIAGLFSSYAEALKAGLGRFGARREFLVKQVRLTEPVYFIS